MESTLVKKARQLMLKRTKSNGAPAWPLTEIAIGYGKALSKKYKVDEELVLTSLYLAHIVFSKKVGGKVQHNHERLSANLAKKYLKKWKVSDEKTKVILNAILAHHDKVKAETIEAEVMKTAECFKFLTIEGALIYLHDLGTRNMTYEQATAQVIRKAEQKLKLISLKTVKPDAQKGYNIVIKLFRHQL